MECFFFFFHISPHLYLLIGLVTMSHDGELNRSTAAATFSEDIYFYTSTCHNFAYVYQHEFSLGFSVVTVC